VKILNHLKEVNGKPIGMETLAIISNQTRQEYQELTEPYLLRMGLISRTSRGRILTNKGLLFLQGLKNE
jgi:Holliday junction DNA helicase RuvB